MSLDIDGYAVLRVIGSQPRLFANVSLEARKAAKALVVKQLKASADVEDLRGVRKAVGDNNLSLLIDSMTDAELKSLASRFDKYHPELKTFTPTRRRQHLDALARGGVQPMERPKKAKAAPSKRVSKTRSKSAKSPGLVSKAMAAVRKR